MNENDCERGREQFNKLADKVQMHSERAIELDGKMKTLEASLAGALERFRTDMAKRDADFERLRTDMAKRDADSERRGKDNFRWFAGIAIAFSALAAAIVGLILRLTGAG